MARILIDALTFHPRDGGFASALRDLLLSCSEMEDFDFIIAHDSKYRAHFREFGMECVEASLPQRFRYLAAHYALPKIVRRIRPDAIHCEISAFPRFISIPASVTVNDLDFLTREKNVLREMKEWISGQYWKRVFLPSLSRAKVVKCLSDATRNDLSFVYPIVRTRVIYPRFVASSAATAAPSWPRNDQPLRIAFVGSLVSRKNVPFLLNALSLVRRSWRLDIVGNIWRSKREIEGMLSDDRVIIHGYVTDKKREELIDRSHLLVLPSLAEGFGYPVAEAMLRERMVLTSDIDIFQEYVPAPCRFSLDNPRHLAAKIDDLDEASYECLRDKCADAVKQFTPQRHIEGHRSLFRSLLGQPGEE